jgi:hypothetical protein
LRARLSVLYAAWFVVSRSSDPLRTSLRILGGQYREDARLRKLVATSARPHAQERRVVMVDQQYPRPDLDAGGARAARLGAFVDAVDYVGVLGVTNRRRPHRGGEEWPAPGSISERNWRNC